MPGALAGSPASAGSVTAPARVILDPVGARLEPGEILVALEYGIPAVVGVPDATARISTGQRITVDGGSGTVVPARPEGDGRAAAELP